MDRWQADVDLVSLWSEDASEQIKVVIDAQVLGDVYKSAHASNKGATAGVISSNLNLGANSSPVQVTKTNVLDYIVDCSTVLDEQNIPESNRWMVIPAWMAGMIKKSELKDASITNDSVSILRNGRIGVVDRFAIYASNNLSSVTDGSETAYNILFGHKSALTFASQITNVETLRAESTFGDLVRGLIVYGYKVAKPESLGLFYAYR
ncbi:hypothetical protein OMAG_001441 [Candidatus Omnitrophus magneticus]|uniref:Capsid protein n=1 Tax=Candidatus Omnitrophus magneticus TaxID=1609969 RepID=A0A0F0CN64_9BACT|nr:hypothetical protein OMAG_001441 [Candidatus Omnitrophus magneticus]